MPLRVLDLNETRNRFRLAVSGSSELQDKYQAAFRAVLLGLPCPRPSSSLDIDSWPQPSDHQGGRFLLITHSGSGLCQLPGLPGVDEQPNRPLDHHHFVMPPRDTMAGNGFYKYRCKYFISHGCDNWVWVAKAPCATCLVSKDDLPFCSNE